MDFKESFWGETASMQSGLAGESWMRLNTLQPIEWPQSQQSLMWLRSSPSNRMGTRESIRSTSSHQPERLTLYDMRLVTQHLKIFDTQTTIDYSVLRISPSCLCSDKEEWNLHPSSGGLIIPEDKSFWTFLNPLLELRFRIANTTSNLAILWSFPRPSPTT